MSQHKLEPPEVPYEEARATVVLWKRGRKKKPDPVHFIYCVWNMVHRYHDGSYEKAADDVKDISERMIRKLARAAEVVISSDKIRQRLQEGKISLEAVSELYGIKNLESRERVTEIVEGMNALDQIQSFRFAKKYPDASIEQFGQRVLSSKDKTERIYMAILPLVEEEYNALKEEAKKLKMSWDKLCMKIIKDWLKERRST